MTDIVTAIVDLLKADTAVAALAGARIYGGELPADQAKDMPQAALVVQPSGGPPFKPSGKVALEAQRFDLVSYGATPFEARQLRDVAYLAMRSIERQVSVGVLIHWVQSAGGYMTGRDRDGAWPYAFQSFQSLFATDEVA